MTNSFISPPLGGNHILVFPHIKVKKKEVMSLFKQKIWLSAT